MGSNTRVIAFGTIYLPVLLISDVIQQTEKEAITSIISETTCIGKNQNKEKDPEED
jgi:hypothetical protein